MLLTHVICCFLTISLSALAQKAAQPSTQPSAGTERSWTPPPKRFTESEWQDGTPSWARTGVERQGTIIWFFVELRQADAVPVLLRALDYGETSIQAQAADKLREIPPKLLPPDVAVKVAIFYDSIGWAGLPPQASNWSKPERDRAQLKLSLLALLQKCDPPAAEEKHRRLILDAPQSDLRRAAEQLFEPPLTTEKDRN